MSDYINIIKESYSGYWKYLKQEILLQGDWANFFYGLIVISLIVFILELFFPWRKDQPVLRKDFWLDTFYMFVNFFLLNLVFIIALSNLADAVVNDVLGLVGLELSQFQIVDTSGWAKPLALLTFFVVADFVQWNGHRLLHRVPFLWNFHKVHHSVKQMGFAAHLRYHWMEPIVYKSLLYIPLAVFGNFSAHDLAIVHFTAISIGHLNHANIGWSYGPLKKIFNNPKMHIWHHAKHLPEKWRYGVNYGISLSLWDYLFGTHYIPGDGRDIELGFDGDENFPESFVEQELYPLSRKE
jgi:sterol desaturase/sphingolipid hydroxylase (fatty acid hydroxylase superfamily)